MRSVMECICSSPILRFSSCSSSDGSVFISENNVIALPLYIRVHYGKLRCYSIVTFCSDTSPHTPHLYFHFLPSPTSLRDQEDAVSPVHLPTAGNLIASSRHTGATYHKPTQVHHELLGLQDWLKRNALSLWASHPHAWRIDKHDKIIKDMCTYWNDPTASAISVCNRCVIQGTHQNVTGHVNTTILQSWDCDCQTCGFNHYDRAVACWESLPDDTYKCGAGHGAISGTPSVVAGSTIGFPAPTSSGPTFSTPLSSPCRLLDTWDESTVLL